MLTTRKGFFENLILLLTGGFFGEYNASKKKISDDKIAVLAKDSLKKEYDLIVVGGEFSGVNAAISAARNGVKVALVHNRSMFGASSSSEVNLIPEPNHRFNPWIKEGGIHEEVMLIERVRNHAPLTGYNLNANWDLALYELIYQESNIDSYLNTHMHRPIMSNDSTIESVYCIQIGSNKDYILSAPVFVDATGDGDLAYFAGADYREGRESRKEFDEPLAPEEPDDYYMGNTYCFKARNIGESVPFKRPEWVAKFESEDDLKRGHHHYPTEDIISGYWWLEIAEPYHWKNDMNQNRHEGLRQLLGVWDHLKNQGDHGIDNYALEFVSTWPYKREGRRIRGDYILSQHDVQNPKLLKDAVAYGAWYIDLHNRGGILERDKVPAWEYFHTVGAMVYGIPLRAMYSRNINNLFVVDRSMSCTYLAFASSRVLSTGAICGEAVGVAASLVKKYKKTPAQIAKDHYKECQQIILKQDGHIPGVVNEDSFDLARNAIITASSTCSLVFPNPNEESELNVPHAQLFPYSGGQIKNIKILIRSKRNSSIKIRLALRSAPHVWDFRSEKDLAVATAIVPAKYEGWVKFTLNIEVTPYKLYYIYTDSNKNIFWKGYQDSFNLPAQTPIGTTAARQPVKPPYSEYPASYRELYPDTTIADLPGAGKDGFWEPLVWGRSLAMKIDPESYPFQAQNVNTGTNRPDQWTNIWISDHAKPLPAWLKLNWSSPQSFNTLQLTFDTNQNYRVTKPLYRYPECVKKYIVEYQSSGGWKQLIKIEDNYMRRKVHNFEPIRTDALRVRVLETNGVPNARIYEIRIYNKS